MEGELSGERVLADDSSSGTDQLADGTDGIRSKLGLTKKKLQEQPTMSPSGDAPERGSTVWYDPEVRDDTDYSLVVPSGAAAATETKPKVTSKYMYDFTHKLRGVAHVFVNIDFAEGTGQLTRTGAKQDMSNFTDAFRRLGFKVKPYLNKTVQQIQHQIREYCGEDHADDDCVVFAFSSHGEQTVLKHSKLASDVIYGVDGIIAVSTITGMLTEDNCPTMAKKPKLFFFQACRGDQLAETVKVSEEQGVDKVKPISYPKMLNEDIRPVEIPLHKDYFIAFSSPPGFYSWRRAAGERCGSWFVTALCDVIKECDGHSIDLLDLVTAVNNRMTNGGSKPEFLSRITKNPWMNNRMIIPWVASMLTKTVLFQPKTITDKLK